MTEDGNGKRPRGTGSLTLVAGTYVARYYSNGKRHHESTHTADRAKAEAWLRRRLKSANTPAHDTPDAPRLRVEDLLQLVADDYRRKGRKSRIRCRAKHVLDHFGGWRAMQVTTAQWKQYVDQRRADGASIATTNREAALMRRAFALAVEDKLLPADMRPVIKTAAEDNARQGFLELSDLDPLLDALRRRDPTVADLVEFSFCTLLRRGNVRACAWQWFQLDVQGGHVLGGELRLPGAVAKNKRPLTLPLSGMLLAVVDRRWQARIESSAAVFHRGDGRPVRRFGAVWRDATVEVGRVGLLFHDLRRSGARALRRLGVDELTIMALGGWKTRSMFARYSIVDGSDLADAQAKLDAALASPGTPKVIPLRRPA